VRDGHLERPWWNSRYNEPHLTAEATLFLMAVIDGKALEEIREELSPGTDPQDFRKWYMRYVCHPMGVEGPRPAAMVALWQKIVSLFASRTGAIGPGPRPD